MTPKERVIATIHNREPDRVPVGEWGIDHDHVSKIIGHHTYWRNRKDTTIALWEGRRDEVVESLKNDYVELIEKLDYELLTVYLVPPKGYVNSDPPRKTGDGVWEDSSGNVYRYAASNDSIVRVTYPGSKFEATDDDIAQMKRDIERIDESEFELIDFIAEKYGEERAILSRDLDIYGHLMSPFGGDQSHQLMVTALAPEQIKKMYGPALEYNRKVIQHCARHNVVISMAGYDFCMNSGCIMSPASIRDIYFPFQKLAVDEVVRHHMVPFFHCCGNTWDILDDFVRVGFKGYQSIQGSAGMDLEKMKREYGRHLTLWTGVQCETLVVGSPAEVDAEVTKTLKFLMPGGGFIFGSTNSVQYGANTDNYLRALDIVRKKGVYSRC